MTVPAEVWPSPQVTVAVSEAAAGLGSLKVVSTPENGCPSTALIGGPDADEETSAAGRAYALRPPVSEMFTTTG